MKKLFLSLFLIPVSLNCFSLPWLSKPQPVTPKVVCIEISDPINFKEVNGQLFRVIKREDIVGAILMLDSSGGFFGPFSVVYDMVKKLSSVKPVVCLVQASAYSCGYMIASAADVIMAHSFSGIGSIGAYATYDRYKNTSIKTDSGVEADLKMEIFKAGEFKDMGNPFGPELTEVQRTFLQASLMKTYETFIKYVAQNRGLKEEDYKIWAEGKTFDAEYALELGLIDGIGTVFDAEEKIKQLIVERNPQFGSVDTIEFVY
jgi:protease-4